MAGANKQESPYGLDVCLNCFSSSSPHPDHNYTALHNALTGHEIYLNIRKVPKPGRQQSPPKMTKLAIEAKKEEDKFDTITSIKDLKFPSEVIDDAASVGLADVVAGVLSAVSYAKREEIKAWELEIVPCEHVLTLQQDTVKVEPQNLVQCSMCDLKENLWLCLTCGNLGCGRAQFGGVGGHSHGLAHYDQSKHPASVKLGSITPEGTADVYCYACNEERQDPNLKDHLANFGIDIASREKTEKSLTELQLEQNLKWDFSMTTEDGKQLEPVYGPGMTGIRNLGNSCYISSVLQCLFALPGFQQRYFNPPQNERNPMTQQPTTDLEVQMCKIADGLLSGRYAVPDDYDTESDVHHQKGISPGMFKALVGRGHEEFSTMRQQDAFEFLVYLLEKVSASSVKNKLPDPTKAFKFAVEQRLECLNCHKIRYKTDPQENLSIPVPARKIDDEKYETITLDECLDQYTSPEAVEYKCKNCGTKESKTQTLFKTYPDVLVLNARRFQIINWVPKKLDIPVEVPDGEVVLDKYKSKGPQADEDVATDEDDDEGAAAKFEPNTEALNQLLQMGFPQVRCEKALHATGNSDAEAAMNWLFAHMEDPDIDEPVELTSTAGGAGSDEPDAGSVQMVQEMGFAPQLARKALKKTGGNVEAAVEWLFNNPDDDGTEDEPASTDRENVDELGDGSLPAAYRLKGIICHKGGSIHAGHYVAFVRQQSGEWVLFNDEKVVKGGEIDEMKKYAYVYVFERQR